MARPRRRPSPTVAKVVEAKVEIAAGTKLSAAMVQLVEVPIAAFTNDSIPDTGLAIGKRVFRAVSAGEQIGFSYFTETGAAVSVTDNIPKGLRAMAVQVDQVTGVGTLIHTGDSVDVIVSMAIQLTGPDPANKANVVNLGVPQTSVKLDPPEPHGHRHPPAAPGREQRGARGDPGAVRPGGRSGAAGHQPHRPERGRHRGRHREPGRGHPLGADRRPVRHGPGSRDHGDLRHPSLTQGLRRRRCERQPCPRLATASR